MIVSHMFAYPVVRKRTSRYMYDCLRWDSLVKIQESLSENSYDKVCATYYILAKEVLRLREVNNLLKSMSGYWAQWLVFL